VSTKVLNVTTDISTPTESCIGYNCIEEANEEVVANLVAEENTTIDAVPILSSSFSSFEISNFFAAIIILV
jgi:hypothetical protein